MNEKLEIFAPAKVNLRLEVLGRREDGYHELQMIMTALTLGDTLTLSKNHCLEMTCDDPFLPVDEGNLVVRAARAFEKRTHLQMNVRFHLAKRIPTAAGLGGGSSDAAAALRGLNRWFDTPLSDDELESLGKDLGADVPFFVRPGHKIAGGIGEILTPITLVPELFLVLINPGYGVSTPEIYKKLRLTTWRKRNKLPVSLEGITQVVRLLRNDLETVAVENYPEIGKIKEHFLQSGCAGCLMSGSGPTVFGIYKDERFLDQVASKAEAHGWLTWVTRTLADW